MRLVKAATLASAISEIKAWTAGPRRDAAVVRARVDGVGVVDRPRRGARAGRRGPRDRAACVRRRLGPARPAVRAGRDRRARRPRAAARREPAVDEAADRDRAGGPGARSVAGGAAGRDHLARDGARLRGPGRALRAAARRRGRAARRRRTSAAAYASEHPDRQEVRIVAAATRAGASYCALRLRAHDEDTSVLTGRRAGAGAGRPGPGHPRGGDRMSDPLEQEYDDFQPRRGSRARILLFVVRRRDRRDLPGLDVRLALHRPALVLLGRLLPGLRHHALDPGRAVRRLRAADGRRGRGQHGHRLPVRGRSTGRTRRSRPASTATATRSRRSARCCWSRWPA